MTLNQKKLESLFEDLEVATKRLQKFYQKEMKGEVKRAFDNQFTAAIDMDELKELKTMVYKKVNILEGLL